MPDLKEELTLQPEMVRKVMLSVLLSKEQWGKTSKDFEEQIVSKGATRRVFQKKTCNLYFLILSDKSETKVFLHYARSKQCFQKRKHCWQGRRKSQPGFLWHELLVFTKFLCEKAVTALKTRNPEVSASFSKK